MKYKEGGNLGGERRDREVRWVIVCEVGVRELDELDSGTRRMNRIKRHVISTFR